MSQFVVDANVAIKWVVPEIYSDGALRLRNVNYTLLVPDFFFPEIGNILWKRVRRGETTLENAQKDLTALMGLSLELHPSLLLMPQALEIGVRIQQAVYDCVYLALAVTHGCQMVTADERFFNALQRDSLATHLCWVEDLP
ncbi:type II toxin-antitoxin system VapC family toxin [Iningainema tapete]|uniref:Type II toxin-antitoxin system VapC family toxin n=1 Tax=Iningainema tapete BLCC-T55 TaxID=2748662 RepID=A0A8J7C7J8_9CYAN|nr:type II toxin-antitoxin system VapC family toxin [Iningainema tapete]MBD2775724.1 type II toxin-antitoxin system VapC family toxin [Iningainema tapete BLCC-T55]